MSASKLTPKFHLEPISVLAPGRRFSLPPSSVCIHKNGIEFSSPDEFEPWTEMTVELDAPLDHRRIQCMGVVVACTGNRHEGYKTSIVFLNLSSQAQAQLHCLATGISM